LLALAFVRARGFEDGMTDAEIIGDEDLLEVRAPEGHFVEIIDFQDDSDIGEFAVDEVGDEGATVHFGDLGTFNQFAHEIDLPVRVEDGKRGPVLGNGFGRNFQDRRFKEDIVAEGRGLADDFGFEGAQGRFEGNAEEFASRRAENEAGGAGRVEGAAEKLAVGELDGARGEMADFEGADADEAGIPEDHAAEGAFAAFAGILGVEDFAAVDEDFAVAALALHLEKDGIAGQATGLHDVGNAEKGRLLVGGGGLELGCGLEEGGDGFEGLSEEGRIAGALEEKIGAVLVSLNASFLITPLPDDDEAGAGGLLLEEEKELEAIHGLEKKVDEDEFVILRKELQGTEAIELDIDLRESIAEGEKAEAHGVGIIAMRGENERLTEHRWRCFPGISFSTWTTAGSG
jgi:hypothetical protein